MRDGWTRLSYLPFLMPHLLGDGHCGLGRYNPTLILPFTSKTGQSVAQNKQKIFFIWVLLVLEDIFWHFIGLISDSDLKGTRDRTKRTGIVAFFNRFLARHPSYQFSASPIFTVIFLGTTETLVTSPAGWFKSGL